MYYWNTDEFFALNLAIQAVDEELQKWREERRERRAARRAAREAARSEQPSDRPIGWTLAEILRPSAH